MTWENVFTFVERADKPEEGGELDWEEVRLHGEEVVPRVDAEHPSAPRAALRYGPVVEGFVEVFTEPGPISLTVIDVTDKKAWGVPRKTELYIDRRDSGTNNAYVYVNPEYIARSIYVNYDYYPLGRTPEIHVSGDRVFWTGPAAGAWFVYDGEEVKNAYQTPGYEEIRAGFGKIYAAGPDLFEFSENFPRVLISFPGKVNPKSVIGYLAQAYGATVDYTPNHLFRFGPAEPVEHSFVPGEVISYIKKEKLWYVPAVEIRYAGGRVKAGTGPRTVFHSNPYIESYRQAFEVAERLKREYEDMRTSFRLKIGEIKDVKPGDIVTFYVTDEDAAVRAVVKTVRIDLMERVTDLDLVLTGKEKGLR